MAALGYRLEDRPGKPSAWKRNDGGQAEASQHSEEAAARAAAESAAKCEKKEQTLKLKQTVRRLVYSSFHSFYADVSVLLLAAHHDEQGAIGLRVFRAVLDDASNVAVRDRPAPVAGRSGCPSHSMEMQLHGFECIR